MAHKHEYSHSTGPMEHKREEMFSSEAPLAEDPCGVAAKHINMYGPDGLHAILLQAPSADAEATKGK